MLFYTALIEDENEQVYFNELYEGYRGRMYAVAYRVLNDHGLAEDAVHDAFLGVAMSIKTIPRGPEAEVRAYLFTCVKHAALRIREKERRQDQIYVQEKESVEIVPSAYEQVEQSEDYERLVRAIRQLDPIYRDVLLMRYVYSLSLDEVAARLCRKKKTVKQQLTRAKKILTELYRKEGAADGAAVNL